MVIRTTLQQIKAQYHISRNLKESQWTKVRRAFWAVVYVGKGLRIALRSVGKEHLGSEVIYKGRRCWVNNWAGSNNPTLCADDFYEENCPRSEITPVRSVKEYWHRFTFMYRWYMTNWYFVDIQGRLME